MRVAMVSEHASPLAALGGVDAGGQNVHVAALAQALARSGVSVEVHTRRDDPLLPERVPLGRGVTVHHLDAGPPEPVPKDELLVHVDAMAAHLAREWRTARPDVVHAHFWMSGLAALRAARDLGIPVVQTFHALGVVKRRQQGEKDTSPPARLALEEEIVRDAAHIVSTCTDEVFELLRLGADRRKLTVIPCGVDLDVFRPTGPAAARTPGAARIVAVGRLVERKGIGNLISALPEVPGAELVVAGGPPRDALAGDPQVARLAAIAREHGVADRVVFAGRQDRAQVAALLRSADVAACVPWYEPFGIVPVEAMACGVPVVATAVGGMIDTVVDGRTGVHVPPRDPERLAEALRELLAHPERRERYGRAGAERARTHYGWERVAEHARQVYGRVARVRTPAAGRGPQGADHVHALRRSLTALADEAPRLEAWGARAARHLQAGGRMLVAGNGGSAAEAQHLTAELVGRFRDERRPLSAICLHGDTSSLTAIANDYGADAVFARQVRAHGRPGDILLLLSTSGASGNLLSAAEAGRAEGLVTWAFTGPGPSPLAAACDETLGVPGPTSATVQELHLVAVHLLCDAIERGLQGRGVAPEAIGAGAGAGLTPEPLRAGAAAP